MRYLDKTFSVGPAASTKGCCPGCVYAGPHADWCDAAKALRRWQQNELYHPDAPLPGYITRQFSPEAIARASEMAR